MTSLAYTPSIDQNTCTHFHCGYTIILCHVSLKISTTSHLLLHVFAQAHPTMPCISLVTNDIVNYKTVQCGILSVVYGSTLMEYGSIMEYGV